MNGEEYEFHIDAFTPKTLPMKRLAEYLRELAELFGHPESVHFRRLKGGSVGVLATVEREAVPKVRVRLQNARDPNAEDSVRKPYKKIDDMLRSDNGVGKLVRGTTNVVKFPGREAARTQRMGPFTEHAEIDGFVLRVGGTDQTAHALIQLADGEVISAECSRDFASGLAHYLYKTPVRVIGNARWERTETGEWELIAFRAKDFQVLKAEPLSSAIGRLRAIEADWKRDADPVALVHKLRGGNGEAH